MKTKIPKKIISGYDMSGHSLKAKKVGIDINNWDILDGRKKRYGRPIKRIAKVLDFGLYLLGCATLSTLIVYLFFAWIA